MVKLKIFAFIVLLTRWTSEAVCSLEETDTNSETSYQLNQVLEMVNDVCSSIDECKLQCCQLNELYFIATNNCNSSDIDGQLSRVYWKEPFSEYHKLSCKLVCSENITDDEKTMKVNQDFQRFVNSVISQPDDLCDNFIEVCFNYSSAEENFVNLAAMDYFRRYWLQVIGVASAISFLSITFILYLLVPELCSRIQDKCFLFHLGAQIVDCCMYLVILNSNEMEESLLCHFYGKLEFIIKLNSPVQLFRSVTTIQIIN